jgi:hypothetical protein
VHLLTTFFPTTTERQAELELCLSHNLGLSWFDKLILFCEKGAHPALTHTKLEFVNISYRPTYGTFFGYANIHFQNLIIAISNTDIMFNETLLKFNTLPLRRWQSTMFCITRTNEDGCLENPGSQDTWVFKAPMPVFDWNIVLGINGCESFLAQKAIESGICLQNPALDIRCLHRHRVPIYNRYLDNEWCYWHASGYKGINIPYSHLT